MEPLILDHLPDGLLECPAWELHQHLSGPTVIHLPGEHTRPLVVSVLQHGNETSGWEAIRRLLRGRYSKDPLPRSLIVLIGNIEAARHNVRYLPTQADLNRCWPGSTLPPTPWHLLQHKITEHIKRLAPFASIDIHNNTGRNPHYAAVNVIAPQALQLASEFSKTVVYFTEPRGVQSHAFSSFCPSVTLECGLSEDSQGADHALAYLEHVLRMGDLPDQFPPPNRLDLYQMFATLTIDSNTEFEFGGIADSTSNPHRNEALRFPADLDQHNFCEWAPGFELARFNGAAMPLMALGHQGRDLTASCFTLKAGGIQTARPLMPAMLTQDRFAIRTDCLCYLMERLNIHEIEHGQALPPDHMALLEAPDQ